MVGKVLNLYTGIGGNRELWKDCEVTAVELMKILLIFMVKGSHKTKLLWVTHINFF